MHDCILQDPEQAKNRPKKIISKWFQSLSKYLNTFRYRQGEERRASTTENLFYTVLVVTHLSVLTVVPLYHEISVLRMNLPSTPDSAA